MGSVQLDMGATGNKDEKRPESAKEKEEPEKDEHPHGVKDLVSDAASNTSTHGVPNIMRTKSIPRRVFWLIVVLGAFGILCWQVTLTILKYFSYPTTTSVIYEHETNVRFPAISICNLNPIMLSKVWQYQGEVNLSHYIESRYEESFSDFDIWEGNITMPEDFDGWYGSGDYEEYDYDEYDYDYEDYEYGDYEIFDGEEDVRNDYIEDFLSFLTLIPDHDLKHLGYKAEDMILSCTWQGKQCKPSQFFEFRNYLYGNCYTFNSGRKGPILRTSKEGPQFSFQLELNIQASEYVPGLADGAGVRVIIHDQRSMPLPEDEGFNVRPGTKTSVEITKHILEHSLPPYGDCKMYEKDDIQKLNAYVLEYPGVGFSTKTCLKTCEQKAIMEMCHCFDVTLPYNETIEAYRGIDIENFQRVCTNDSDITDERRHCLEKVVKLFVEDELGCNKLCQKPCTENDYPYVLSSVTWPSRQSEDLILAFAAKKSEELWTTLTNDEWTPAQRTLWAQNNLLKMEFYFTHFNNKIIREEPLYDLLSLISDFGGNCGLWMGLSMIALFELIELVWDLVGFCITKCKNKRDKKTKVDYFNSENNN